MANLIENETVKLVANWLNGMSLTVIGAGIVIPVINQVIGSNPISRAGLVLLVLGCLIFAYVLHLFGRKVLRGLHDPDKQ